MSAGASGTRREFLAAGLASLAAGASACSRPGPPGNEAPRTGRTTVRTLGRTGLRLPVVSIGSVTDPDLVRAALDGGLTYLHTSGTYSEANHERMLGRVLAGRPRESFAIGSSPDLPYKWSGRGLSDDLGTAADPAQIGASIGGCLERLGLSFVDVYFLASINDPATVLHEPYMQAYAALKRSGRIRFAGIATHANEPAVIRAVARSGFWDVVLTSYNFRQSHRDDVRAAIAEAAAAGVGVLAMKTQAGVYWDSFRLRRINMKAALKWVLQDEHVCSAIPAFANHDELSEDLEVMRDLELSRQEELDLRSAGRLGHRGLYCQQCSRCVGQCPHAVDLPSLMRGYMYSVGYREPRLARIALRGVDLHHVACVRCHECAVSCALGFDVRDRARQVARLATGPLVPESAGATGSAPLVGLRSSG